MQGKMDAKIIDNYIITNQRLGEGTFGTVYRGYLKDDKAKILAVKQIELKNLKGDYKLLKRELELLNLLQAPNIVKFYKPMRTPNNLYFFLEYCETDLKKYMKTKKDGYLAEAQAVGFLRNICEGFKALQQNNVIHRDIKPANILIKNGVAKITDFGFARVVDDVDMQVAHTFLGSPLYMSPEILAKKKFSAKCDVWSLGMTFYEMLYGRTPWTAGNINALLENIRTKKLEFPEHPHRSQEVKELLHGMLAISQEQRLSWNDIFLHDLITGVRSKRIQSRLNELASSPMEDLQKSYTLNQLYIQNNKVLNQAHQIESLQDSGLSRQQSEKEKITSNNDHEADLKYQQMRQREEEMIEKVDRYFRYRRNVLVYVNITTNMFFSQCKPLLPLSLFYMGVFSLQKYQVYGYQSLIQTFNSKKQPQRFSDKQWQLYRASNYYWKTLKSFKTDNRYLVPYYLEVYNVSAKYFDKQPIEQEYLDTYKQFKQHHSSNLSEYSPKAYEAAIEQILLRLKQSKASPQLVQSLSICLRPLETLTEQTDFYQLYEDDSPVEKTESVAQLASQTNC